jgi:hypothetical protein
MTRTTKKTAKRTKAKAASATKRAQTRARKTAAVSKKSAQKRAPAKRSTAAPKQKATKSPPTRIAPKSSATPPRAKAAAKATLLRNFAAPHGQARALQALAQPEDKLNAVMNAIDTQLTKDGHSTAPNGMMKDFYNSKLIEGFLDGVKTTLATKGYDFEFDSALGTKVLKGSVADAAAPINGNTKEKALALQARVLPEGKLNAIMNAIDAQLTKDGNPTSPNGMMTDFYDTNSIAGFFGGVKATLVAQGYDFEFDSALGTTVLNGKVADVAASINGDTK